MTIEDFQDTALSFIWILDKVQLSIEHSDWLTKDEINEIENSFGGDWNKIFEAERKKAFMRIIVFIDDISPGSHHSFLKRRPA